MYKEYKIGDVSDLVPELKEDFPEAQLKGDDILRLHSEFFEGFSEGSKLLTVRFKPGFIRYPCNSEMNEKNRLGLYETKPDDEDYCERVGNILIPKMAAGNFQDFPEEIAIKDGYSGKSELRDVLNEIYEPIYGRQVEDEDFLSAYFFGEFSPNHF